MIDLRLEDCIFGMKNLPKENIDCIITSPPYKNEDGYSEQLIRDCFTECYRILKNNSLCWINFGHLAQDKLRPFRVALILDQIGFKLNETFIWVKNHHRPIQGSRRVNNIYEFVFCFYKGKMPKLDRLAVGVPYKDKSNIKRFSKNGDLRCGANVWHIPYETIQHKDQKLHNDRYPIDLPLRCLKLSGIKPPFIVLDPFMGSGSTGVACQQLNLDFVGFEIKKEHFNTAQKRLGQLSYISNEEAQRATG